MADGNIRQIVRRDNTELYKNSYASGDIIFNDDNIGVHLVGSHYAASGSAASIRNVFKQLCSDPCNDKENCTPFFDNCGTFPSAAPTVKTIDVEINFNFEISAEIRTEDYSGETSGQDLAVFHIATADWDSASKGVRLFGMWLDHGDNSVWIRKAG